MTSLGTRLQVFRGTRSKTAGGLTKGDLRRNKVGKIVSKKASQGAKRKSNLGRYLSKKTKARKRKVKPTQKTKLTSFFRKKK